MKSLDKAVRAQIRKKIDEIERRIREDGIDPNVAVEKRLRSPYHRFLQQRVGDYRLWFVDIPEDEVFLVAYVWKKEEARRRLGG